MRDLFWLWAVSSSAQRQYHFVYEQKNWTEAQQHCRQYYTDLAAIESMEDVKTLNNMADLEKMKYSEYTWIGLFRDSWKWIDGSSSSFRYWDTKEPNNNFHKEMCVAAYFEKEGKWEDWNCDYKRAFVCYSGKLAVWLQSVDLH
uniref:C-type lectin domain-containing protein n=1 Tax=Pundamilia nyererei TaxID=303518 RepID=A0A3B4F7P0_9CICH